MDSYWLIDFDIKIGWFHMLVSFKMALHLKKHVHPGTSDVGSAGQLQRQRCNLGRERCVVTSPGQ